MRILGIDPGTREFAWAIYDTELDKVLDYRHHTLSKKDSLDSRLREAETILISLIRQGDSTDLIAYEKMFSMGNGADAPLAVFAWLIRNRAWWAEKLAIEIPHTSVYKEVVGDGKATKEEIKASLETRFEEVYPSADVSDAVAIAIAATTYKPKKKKPRKEASKEGKPRKPREPVKK